MALFMQVHPENMATKSISSRTNWQVGY